MTADVTMFPCSFTVSLQTPPQLLLPLFQPPPPLSFPPLPMPFFVDCCLYYLPMSPSSPPLYPLLFPHHHQGRLANASHFWICNRGTNKIMYFPVVLAPVNLAGYVGNMLATFANVPKCCWFFIGMHVSAETKMTLTQDFCVGDCRQNQ